MKKILSVILAALLMMVPALAETVSVEGAWYLVAVAMEGMEINPADLGIDMSIVLNADGSAELTSTGVEPAAATWAFDGTTVTITEGEELPVAFTLTEDGTLVTEEAGLSMIFSREAVSATVIAPALENVTVEDFNGEWIGNAARTMGMYMPITELGLNVNVAIDNGSITLTMDGESTTGVAVLEGNALTCVLDEADFTMTLLEDGTLCMATASGEATLEIFCVSAEAAAEIVETEEVAA